MMFCLAAPGYYIYSSVPGGYGALSGTSMATPHVSGGVAIARQMFPNASTAETAGIILQTATDLGAPGIDAEFGWASSIWGISSTR